MYLGARRSFTKPHTTENFALEKKDTNVVLRKQYPIVGFRVNEVGLARARKGDTDLFQAGSEERAYSRISCKIEGFWSLQS